MKTINTPAYVYKVDDLATKIQNTIASIVKHTESKNYQLSGNYLEITTSGLQYGLRQMSKNGLKKINKSIIRVNKKMTIKSINLFLHYVMKDVLKSDIRIKYKVSIKEETIQSKRQEWLKAKVIADSLLLSYKEEKGDFYKNEIN